jgi:hypothetical protein
MRTETLLDSQLMKFVAVQVASFPFDDHNCPPLQLVAAFCQSAYSWLKGDLENVVVVHCKAGMARTGLMISSLLLYLKVLLIICAWIVMGRQWTLYHLQLPPSGVQLYSLKRVIHVAPVLLCATGVQACACRHLGFG